MEKTPSQILTEAANILESPNKWTTGKFFYKEKNQPCTMCAHGAISYCGDAQIRNEVDASSAINTNLLNCTPAIILNTLYERYDNKMGNECDNNVRLAHKFARQAGITIAYNDTCSDVKPVIKKLREAAQLAEITVLNV